jgi:hypothetical protein
MPLSPATLVSVIGVNSRPIGGYAMWLRHGSGLLLAGMFWGCSTVSGPSLPTAVPVFHADATDSVLLRTIQREQNSLLSTCAQSQSCDQVHFTRAMVSLFQNGEAAADSFRQAIDAAPKGPFADSSERWIRFLAHGMFHHESIDKPNRALVGVMKGLVRTWLRQQRATTTVNLRASESAQNPDLAVHTLQRQVHEHDKRIAELTDQLSALSRIDSEAQQATTRSLSRTLSR